MPHKGKEEICTVKAFREMWKILKESENLEEAKEKFKKLVLKIILEEP